MNIHELCSLYKNCSMYTWNLLDESWRLFWRVYLIVCGSKTVKMVVIGFNLDHARNSTTCGIRRAHLPYVQRLHRMNCFSAPSFLSTTVRIRIWLTRHWLTVASQGMLVNHRSFPIRANMFFAVLESWLDQNLRLNPYSIAVSIECCASSYNEWMWKKLLRCQEKLLRIKAT